EKRWFSKKRKYTYSKEALISILFKNINVVKKLESYKILISGSITKKNDKWSKNSSDILGELNGMVGLDNIKNEITELYADLKMRKRKGKIKNSSQHMIFYGPPGTGKTSVARLIGRIFKNIGILKKGHVIETDRTGLVAPYIGQTAPKTTEVIQKALDGVLFIDEAYSLTGKGNDDFGLEAIEVLIKKMEDYRNRMIVI